MISKRENKRKKRGISTVLTTIIILVASVVMGSGIILYGTSLFQDNTLQDDISTRGITMWVDPADTEPAWGAAAIRNSGDKIVSVDTIQVRGTDVPLSSWYVDKDQTRVSLTNFQAQMVHTGYSGTNGMLNDSDPDSDCTGAGSDLNVDLDGAGGESALCMSIATSAEILNPGERMIVYFKVPSGILASIDAGKSTGINIYASSTGSPHSVTVLTP